MMKNFFQKQREVLALLLYAAFVALLVYGGIFPLIAKIDSAKDQIQQESLNQQGSKERLSQLPKIQDQASTIEKNAPLLDVLLDRNSAVVLIEDLEKLAEDSGDKIAITVADGPVINTSSAQPTAKNPKDESLAGNLPSANYLELKIGLTGDFAGVDRFINSLENFEYYCDIVGIDIKKNDDTNAGTQSSVGSGLVNPFDANGKPVVANSLPSASVNTLDASLDVVFYTK